MTDFNRRTVTPGVIARVKRGFAVVGDAVQILLVVAALQHQVGVDARLMHPRGIELGRVLIEIAAAAVSGGKAFLLGVSVPQGRT